MDEYSYKCISLLVFAIYWVFRLFFMVIAVNLLRSILSFMYQKKDPV